MAKVINYFSRPGHGAIFHILYLKIIINSSLQFETCKIIADTPRYSSNYSTNNIQNQKHITTKNK